MRPQPPPGWATQARRRKDRPCCWSQERTFPHIFSKHRPQATHGTPGQAGHREPKNRTREQAAAPRRLHEREKLRYKPRKTRGQVTGHPRHAWAGRLQVKPEPTAKARANQPQKGPRATIKSLKSFNPEFSRAQRIFNRIFMKRFDRVLHYLVIAICDRAQDYFL